MNTQPKKPTKRDVGAFERAAERLAKLGQKGLHIYMADDSLCLLNGPSHQKTDDTAQQDRVVASVYIPGAGGGAW